jgi:hypothetical protein
MYTEAQKLLTRCVHSSYAGGITEKELIGAVNMMDNASYAGMLVEHKWNEAVGMMDECESLWMDIRTTCTEGKQFVDDEYFDQYAENVTDITVNLVSSILTMLFFTAKMDFGLCRVYKLKASREENEPSVAQKLIGNAALVSGIFGGLEPSLYGHR